MKTTELRNSYNLKPIPTDYLTGKLPNYCKSKFFVFEFGKETSHDFFKKSNSI